MLTDPDIEEPAQIAFDGNGRMFVLELRGYMQDADGGGELDPIGRISLHEDTNNDGVYETHHVFVDKLVFPRFVMPFGANAILAKESNADEVWKYTDTNNDSVADKKELFATGMGRVMNVEHQESGLTWATRQLDLQHHQRVPRLSGRRAACCASPPARTAASGASPWTTTARCGSRRAPAACRLLPAADPLRQLQRPEQFETDLNITWGAPVLIADMQGGMPRCACPTDR